MDGRVTLEPGEIEALVMAARLQARSLPEWHPRRAMLLAVADAVEVLLDCGGALMAPAPLSLRRAAARALVRGIEPGQEPAAHGLPGVPGAGVPGRSLRLVRLRRRAALSQSLARQGRSAAAARRVSLSGDAAGARWPSPSRPNR